jgi:hypothetical protein
MDDNKKACMLYYKISRSLGVRNPSRSLSRHAVRVDGSVWEFPLERQPAVERVMKRYADAAAVVGFRVYDDSEWPKVKARAMEALAAEAGRIRDTLTKSIARGEDYLVRAERLQSANDVKKGKKFLRSSLNRARRELRAASECALAFDLTGDVNELFAGIASEVAAKFTEFFSRAESNAENGGGLEQISFYSSDSSSV